MMSEKQEKMWDVLVERGIATDAEVSLVVSINGLDDEVFTDILYSRTGYRTFEQIGVEI